jgi:dTDP-glucose pyrophosphorylase
MKYAIIPAAGSGTRMKELGKNYAKTVLPYEGKPILVHIIESIEETINPDKTIVVYSNDDHLSQLKEAVGAYGKLVEFVQVDPTGRQGPAKSIISGIPVDVNHTDELFIHLSDFVTVNRNALTIPTDCIAAFPVSDQHRWCMVESSSFKLSFFDKPKERVSTDLAVAGLYRISDAKYFLEASKSKEDSSVGEFQISEMLSAYNVRYPMTVSKIDTSDLKDFGTIEEFIQNRGISKSRSFNKIERSGNFVFKTSETKRDKLREEYFWYRSIPSKLAIFTPRVFDMSAGGYSMELVKSTNLRELYLYLDRSQETWDEVFSKVGEFIQECKKETLSGYPGFWDSIFEKNYSRIEGTEYEHHKDFLDKLHKRIKAHHVYDKITWFHGDLHFANMFYCFHYKELKLIDPNGRLSGHWLYDIAKLYHSVIGKYDWIDSELYSSFGFVDKGIDGVHLAFNKFMRDIGLSDDDIDLVRQLTASLFLTMIPLHDHSKKNQELFYKEFLRLSV